MALIAALTLHAAPRLRSATAARRRFGLVLCASVLAHACFLSPLAPAPPPQLLPSFTINARIEAREMGPGSPAAGNGGAAVAPSLAHLAPELTLEAIAVPGTVAPAGETKEGSSQAPLPARQARAPRKSNVTASARHAGLAPASQRTPTRERELPVLPQPADATWYAAHDLDTYPRALAPLEFEHFGLAGSVNARTRLLLWLRIDEHGQVVDVSAGEMRIPGQWLDAARASLMTVPFMPARKDERPVKSRLLLSIDFAGR